MDGVFRPPTAGDLPDLKGLSKTKLTPQERTKTEIGRGFYGRSKSGQRNRLRRRMRRRHVCRAHQLREAPDPSLSASNQRAPSVAPDQSNRALPQLASHLSAPLALSAPSHSHADTWHRVSALANPRAPSVMVGPFWAPLSFGKLFEALLCIFLSVFAIF